jgi:hypothetical protein
VPGLDAVEEAVLSAAFEPAALDFVLRCFAVAMGGTIHGPHDEPEKAASHRGRVFAWLTLAGLARIADLARFVFGSLFRIPDLTRTTFT